MASHDHTPKSPPDPIPGLKVSVAQVIAQDGSPHQPPTVLVKVTNTNAHPLSALTYGSPLDPLALPLGLVSVTPDGAGGPLGLPTIRLRRVWPPKLAQVVTIEAGGEATNEVVLKKDVVEMVGHANKAKVAIKGKWQSVWGVTKEEIGEESLANPYGSAEAFQGEFEAEEVEVAMK